MLQFFGIFQTRYIYLYNYLFKFRISSDSVQYTETINRSSNGTAEGCVSGVTAGEYVVRVYDQSSSELVHEVDNVTEFNHFSQNVFMYVYLHTVNRLFFIIEKFSSFRLLKIFHPKIFLTLLFFSTEEQKRKY